MGFLHRFGLKTGIDFAHFGPESGMVFEGTTGVYERTSLQLQICDDSKCIMSQIFFCCRSNLSNDEIIP